MHSLLHVYKVYRVRGHGVQAQVKLACLQLVSFSMQTGLYSVSSTLLLAAIETKVSCLSLSCCATLRGRYWS